jgi:hypothetical protein
MQTVVLDGKESSLWLQFRPPSAASQRAYLNQLAVRLLEVPYLMTNNFLTFRGRARRQLPSCCQPRPLGSFRFLGGV